VRTGALEVILKPAANKRIFSFKSNYLQKNFILAVITIGFGSALNLCLGTARSGVTF
jgi:hypothetical protein